MKYFFFTFFYLSLVLNMSTSIFINNFTTDSTAQYTIEDTWIDSGAGNFVYESIGQSVHVPDWQCYFVDILPGLAFLLISFSDIKLDRLI